MGMFDFILGSGEASIDPNVGAQVSNINTLAGDVRTQTKDLLAQKKELYDPVTKQFVTDASTIDSPQNQEIAAGQAGAQVRSSYGKASEANARNLARLGINPGSGKATAFSSQAALDQAAQEAGTMNATRQAVKDRGVALRAGVVNQGNVVQSQIDQGNSTALSGYNTSGNLSLGVSQMQTQAEQACANNVSTLVGMGLGAWAGM